MSGPYRNPAPTVDIIIEVPGEDGLQLGEQLLPSGVLIFLAGQGIQVPSFNFVDQFHRFAVGRNEVEPAASHHQARW